jgi:mannose-6-phosphate isomerase-like protein (cupin superfamily)
MRRVVAGVNADGHSYLVSDDDLGEPAPSLLLWSAKPATMPNVEHIDPATAATTIEPPVGGQGWMLVAIAPDSDPATAAMRAAVPGLDEDGFHTTRTLDYDYIVSGDATLVLDDDCVEVHAGDVVVICAARHAWHNPHDVPVRILSVLTSLMQ